MSTSVEQKYTPTEPIENIGIFQGDQRQSINSLHHSLDLKHKNEQNIVLNYVNNRSY
jgi:hypothetical protein